MTKKFLLQAVVLAVGLTARAGTSPLYVNHGLVEEAPQIDAAAFYNDGIFDIFTTLPFTTLNTVNYTNRGILLGSPGFQFNYTGSGSSKPAGTIVNQGSIIGVDQAGVGIINGDDNGFVVIPTSSGLSWVRLNATNIFSSGILSAGEGGLLEISAKNADLSRAAVRTGVSPFGATGGSSDSLFNQGSNFIDAAGIAGVYWGFGTNQAITNFPALGAPLVLDQLPAPLDVPFPQSPIHQVENNSFRYSAILPASFFSTNRYSGFTFFSAPNDTSEVYQVVFVVTNLGPNLTAQVRYGAGGQGARVPVIRMGARNFDTSLNAYVTNALYISDSFETQTNTFYSVNINDNSLRPNNYRVATSPLPGWTGGLPGNKNFNYYQDIWNFLWSASVVTNAYTAYSFTLNQESQDNVSDFLVGLPSRGLVLFNPFVPYFFDPTNRQGRTEIKVDGSLNLTRTRLRGQNYAQVDSPHIIYDQNTIFDSPVLSLNIGTTNGSMSVANLIPTSVDRISGQIYMWSAKWTNQLIEFSFDPNDGSQSSNITLIRNHLFFVDNENISETVPVLTTEANFSSTNVSIADTINVGRSFRQKAENLTVSGFLSFQQQLIDLGPTNFPGLKNLTNNGFIFNSGNTVLSGPSNQPINTLNNSGSWFSGSQIMLTRNLVNEGTLYAFNGPLTLSSTMADLSQGEALSNLDIHLNFSNLVSQFSVVSAGTIDTSGRVPLLFPGAIFINVTNHVDDGGEGPGSGITINDWSATDGFIMNRKPLTGDFLGTTFRSFAYQFSEVVHVWAGQDRGADIDGFQNNAAMGRLILDGAILSTFTFAPANGNNALYVENLEFLNSATNIADSLNILPGMKIYFSNSNLPVDQLNGMFDGRLVYLPLPTSPSETLITLLTGQTLTVKSALLANAFLDSDGDGIPNAFDSNPFDEVIARVDILKGTPQKALISWIGAPMTQYELQYKDGVADSGWKTLHTTVTMAERRWIKFTDPDGSSQRFYRVIYRP